MFLLYRLMHLVKWWYTLVHGVLLKESPEVLEHRPGFEPQQHGAAEMAVSLYYRVA